MNRRQSLAILAGSLMSSISGDPYQWIVVAHGGVNANGRTYEPLLLQKMALLATGAKVGHAKEDRLSLQELLGVVSRARVKENRLGIQVRWFSSAMVPRGAVIVPWGHGTVINGIVSVKDYSLTHFQVETEIASAFEEASNV